MSIDTHDFSDIFRRIGWFFLPLLLFWGISVYLWSSLGYEGAFIWLNTFHIPLVDGASLYFFTHLGDGLILPALLVLFFWRKDPGLAVAAVIAVLLTGILSQIGKNVLFTDWARPAHVFFGDHTIDILHPHPPGSRSFPSGHATSVATGGVFFAYHFAQFKRWFPVVIGFLTVGLCYTRVVIGVHFPGDIFVGSLIGCLGAVLLLRYLHPWLRKRLYQLRGETSPKSMYIAMAIAGLVVIFQYIQLLLHT